MIILFPSVCFPFPSLLRSHPFSILFKFSAQIWLPSLKKQILKKIQNIPKHIQPLDNKSCLSLAWTSRQQAASTRLPGPRTEPRYFRTIPELEAQCSGIMSLSAQVYEA